MSQLIKKRLNREYRGIAQVLPLLVIALLCAMLMKPLMTSATSTGSKTLLSPISPVSPISSKLPREKVLPSKTAQPTKATIAAPTVTATIRIEYTEPPPPERPQSLPPAEIPETQTTPPTLWVVLGLIVVGGIVAGLIVIKRK